MLIEKLLRTIPKIHFFSSENILNRIFRFLRNYHKMDQNFCKCPTAKTQKYISDNGNICPTCNLTLAENNDDLVTLLRGLTMGNVSGATRSANAQGVRLKPPTFDGSGDCKHFIVKLANYMETYRIGGPGETVRLLKSCLEGAALDLFLSLSLSEQSDLEELGQIYSKTISGHFRIELSKLRIF